MQGLQVGIRERRRPSLAANSYASVDAASHVAYRCRSSLSGATLTSTSPPSSLEGGTISLDGLDLGALPLGAVRSRLAVCSQDALFFSGTLRRNLDPFTQHTDEELISVLQRVRLLDFAAASAAAASRDAPTPLGPLDADIAERGGNLSAGQQQLLALARACLRRPALLCMDEATANLDIETEAHVNDTVRHVFADSTVLSIAHRLASVVSCHLVLVMAQGRIVECGHPYTLLQREAASGGGDGRGTFASMAAAMGEGEAGRLTRTAREAFAQHKAEGKLASS